MTEHAKKKEPKLKLVRCIEWLQNQNDQEKLSLPNKNDKQLIIETNAQGKNDGLTVADDIATVPAGVDEPSIEPKTVPLRLLRKENLRMECEWQACKSYYNDYQLFQKHVAKHVSDLHVIEVDGNVQYVCLWDVCGHSTSDFPEIVRHINYHAYHAKLMAIGFNGRATLKLERCKKDSTKRNVLPSLKAGHCCMWVGCTESFNSIQLFFDHVKYHICCSDEFLCSWAGCGAVFHRRVLLTMHVRSHTQEKLIACFHCGHHFACNGKLSDHLLRQKVPVSGDGAGEVHACSLCGLAHASAALRREHERQHVSAYACALCDMSAPSRAALAHHVRYRHLEEDTRTHKCPHCEYKAVTKFDLRKHIPTHTRKKKQKLKKSTSDIEISDEEEEDEEGGNKKKKVAKKYACHMCPEKEVKVFSRGTRLTTHLVKVHGAQWPFGHCRFRYQLSEDGMYRLTTTRFEFEDISKKIVDGYSWPKESLTNKFEFDLKQIAEATINTPKRFEITLKNYEVENKSEVNNKVESKSEVNNAVEIMMCDVDEEGNIISTETITDVIYS